MTVLEPDLTGGTEPGANVVFRKKLDMEKVEDRSPNLFSPATGDF
jgi:hypothetical protein